MLMQHKSQRWERNVLEALMMDTLMMSPGRPWIALMIHAITGAVLMGVLHMVAH